MTFHLLMTCRLLLAGVFLVALAGKVRGRAAFAAFTASIRALGLLPRPWAAVAAYALVAAELVTAALLLATRVAGLAAAAVTLAVMTGGVLAALLRGRRAPCRCFGPSTRPLGRTHVARNLLLIAVAGAGLAAGGSGDPAHPAGLVLSAVAAAVGVLVVVRLDDLAALFSAPSHVRK
ncbi:MauE/DoxX family redox-associated membrane protein [Nonomuraea sp. GTA35]|uniref:MauE/DoxX family redox-associated membrane protein n=1 Tax=Nonomuraea sp. GTA35 TaxID=1676746 RepID=UPI0035C186EC